MSIHLKADTNLAQPELDALRVRGQVLAQAKDWAGLWALRPEFETDSQYWPDLWGPACALAARKLGQPGAIELLGELVLAAAAAIRPGLPAAPGPVLSTRTA